MYKTSFGTLRPAGGNCIALYDEIWAGRGRVKKFAVAANRTNSAFNSVFGDFWKIVKEVGVWNLSALVVLYVSIL